MKNFVYNLLFWIGISATAANLGLYNDAAKSIAMAVFALLFIMALFRSKLKNIPRVFVWWFVFILVGAVVCLLHQGNVQHAINTAIPLMICFSSTFLFDENRENTIKWFVPFSMFFGYCAIMSIVKGVGSFEMAEYYLEGISKNQLCPFFTIISTVAFCLAIQNKMNLLIRIYLFAVTVICLFPSLYLLNRASLIGFGIASVFIVYTKGQIKGVLILAFFVGLIWLTLGTSITDVLFESIVGKRDVADLDSLTSGRIGMNKTAFDYFLNHMWFGEIGLITGQLNINPHLCVLWTCVRYGLIGGLPFLLIYGSIIWLAIKGFRQRDLLCVGVLLIALLESLVEYSSPFGPGTTYVFCYIIVGQFIKKNYYANNMNYGKDGYDIGRAETSDAQHTDSLR